MVSLDGMEYERCGNGRSAAADRLDDFDDIAFCEQAPAVLAARDDFQIHFHRQTPALQTELFDQQIDTGLPEQGLTFAIDRYIHVRRFYMIAANLALPVARLSRREKPAVCAIHSIFAQSADYLTHRRITFSTRTQGEIGVMKIFRFVLLPVLLFATAHVNAAVDSNPFAKEKHFDFGTDIAWNTSSESMTKTVFADDNYYHLFFDGRQLRLRITMEKADDNSSAKSFDAFAVNDILIDGKRNAVFQWCLNNQDRHSRFLQQGLSVKKDICINDGAHGVYTMQLNQQTVDSLRNGSKLTFVLKPYRTPVELAFDITDFQAAVSKMQQAKAAELAASKPPEPSHPAVVSVAAAAPKTKCTLKPPAEFAEIKAVEYVCDDESEKTNAKATLSAQIDKALAAREKLAVEKERKRKAEEQARLEKEEKTRREQEALAASAALQQELSSDIAKKMIAVCQKKWSAGEHRCYCEKYIQFAPAGIVSDPSCTK